LDRDLSWNIVSLNFEFLLFLDHGDVIWYCPKGKVLGRRMGILRYIVLEKKNYRYFVVKNHKFYFILFGFYYFKA
jgi:hypothetical protein